MKINLLDNERLIDINKLQEITSPRLFSTKMMFDPEGILSNDIFGISRGDRRETFAYIDLKGHYIHPHLYVNVLKRIKRNVILYILSGQRKYTVDKNGVLVEDMENGWTGINALYDNWDKINWSKLNSSNERSIKLLSSITRDEAFITKLLVIPPAYRDVTQAGTKDSSDHVHELNKYYQQLISKVSLITKAGLIARNQRLTQMQIQDQLAEIFEYLKDQIQKKTGLIRKYLIGKSVDYGTRAVISAPQYNNERLEDNMIDIEHGAVPISHCCASFYPLIESWVHNFFTREIVNDPSLVAFYDIKKNREVVATVKEPDVQFSDKAIRKLINNYCFNPDNRFNPIKVDVVISGDKNGTTLKAYMLLKGKKILDNNVQETLDRPMTVTDILYIACVDVCEKRHAMITRYPVGTDKGVIFNKIRVQSTKKHIRLVLNGKEYPHYPDIDNTIDHEYVGVQFVDSLVFSNSFLEGMGGDYDGDQVTLRGLWSDEANLEAESIMNRKLTALNVTGSNSKVVAKEVLTSLYELTREGKEPKKVKEADIKEYLALNPNQITRSRIAGMFADLADNSDTKNVNKKKSYHNSWDKFTVPSNYFYEGQPRIETTIGRFIFNKFILEGSGVIAHTKYFNDTIIKSTFGNLDNSIGDMYLNDIINRKQFNDYVDRRDTLGFWLNGMLAHTISEKMLKPLKEVEKRKAELCKEYEKEIANGNIDVMTKISDELVALAKKILADDPGMNLYLSGELDFGNNFKNNSILKGPVANVVTGKYDFISSSFMNGIEIKDIPAHANSILTAQYPSSIATKDSGYLGKQLLALLQMMQIDEPGTDCGTRALIPITVTKTNKNALIYSYVDIAGQLQLLTRENIDKYMGKTLMMRSPMSCTGKKICNKCAGELFYKLGVENAGLTATQLSHSALNLALKAKHSQIVNLYTIDPSTIIKDI